MSHVFQQGKKRDKPRPQISGGMGLLPPPPGGKIAPPPSSGTCNHNTVPQTGGTETGSQTTSSRMNVISLVHSKSETLVLHKTTLFVVLCFIFCFMKTSNSVSWKSKNSTSLHRKGCFFVQMYKLTAFFCTNDCIYAPWYGGGPPAFRTFSCVGRCQVTISIQQLDMTCSFLVDRCPIAQ